MDLGKVKRTIEVVPEKTPAHSPAEPSPQPVPVER